MRSLFRLIHLHLRTAVIVAVLTLGGIVVVLVAWHVYHVQHTTGANTQGSSTVTTGKPSSSATASSSNGGPASNPAATTQPGTVATKPGAPVTSSVTGGVAGGTNSSTSGNTSGGTTSAKPSAANTGVPAGISLATINGDYIMQTSGVTLSNKHITGDLYLSANNLVLHNIQVDGTIGFNSLPGGNYLQASASNISIDHCSTSYLDVSKGFDNFTVDACHIGNTVCTMGAIYPWNGIGHDLMIENSLWDGEQSVPANGSHCEALHGFGGTYVSLLNNVFDFRVPDMTTWNQTTATINLSVETSPANDHFTLDGNWFYGGSFYQMYFIASNSVVKNNKFTTYTSPDGSQTSQVQYPPAAYSAGSLATYGGSYPKFTQSGNTLDGNPYNLPGGF